MRIGWYKGGGFRIAKQVKQRAVRLQIVERPAVETVPLGGHADGLNEMMILQHPQFLFYGFQAVVQLASQIRRRGQNVLKRGVRLITLRTRQDFSGEFAEYLWIAWTWHILIIPTVSQRGGPSICC